MNTGILEQLHRYSIGDPPWGYESSLVSQWLALKPGTVCKDIAGQTIYVLEPGKQNKHEGPDIFQAVLQIGDRLKTGFVECHVESRNWKAHGHQDNPLYDSVILHVVRKLNSGIIFPEIPTVILPENCAKTAQYCDLNQGVIRNDFTSVLNKFSSKRWQEHISKFLVRFMNNDTVRKKLIRECFRLLGAGGNEAPFLTLARNLDDERLSQLNLDDGVEHLTSLGKGDEFTWHRRGIRPAHHPEKRISAAVALVHLIWSNELLAVQNPEGMNKLLHNWLHTLSGEGLCTELLGNVFYPYFGAKDLSNGKVQSYLEWVNSWLQLRLPYSYQTYQSRYKNVFPLSKLKLFSFLQGLKYLDKFYCKPRTCRVCPLKKLDGCLD